MNLLTDFDDCLKKGLIQKTAPSKEQALLSLGKAKEALEDAKANFSEKRYDAATIIAYMSLLNAAKAILFRDGYREKSHICIVRYLEAKHAEIGLDKIALFDSFRETRHEVQYSAAFRASAKQAEAIVNFAADFIKNAEEIVG